MNDLGLLGELLWLRGNSRLFVKEQYRWWLEPSDWVEITKAPSAPLDEREALELVNGKVSSSTGGPPSRVRANMTWSSQTSAELSQAAAMNARSKVDAQQALERRIVALRQQISNSSLKFNHRVNRWRRDELQKALSQWTALLEAP